ncbi:hypothetical protein Sgou_59670 [Streptomyces gougerotii]|uniref:Uncharacterized protein n=1 Tax=Streptomyces gougerotii TaxID=53448 RepID=A0A8H9HPQ5_9ACTN|nr:hypothetical protein Srut_37370 [Streptomyces rutgersensis]GFH81297.1 hypothetical protein Sgou_59670 [Streptomyces gougerotii]GGU75191.1 hypothetical protein GCM10010227_32010 [Streptomyces gougerotii]
MHGTRARRVLRGSGAGAARPPAPRGAALGLQAVSGSFRTAPGTHSRRTGRRPERLPPRALGPVRGGGPAEYAPGTRDTAQDASRTPWREARHPARPRPRVRHRARQAVQAPPQ